MHQQQFNTRPMIPRFRAARPPLPRSNTLQYRRPPTPGNRLVKPGCIRCVEARRYDASRFHTVQECPYPRQSFQPPPGMKVLLVQDTQSVTNQQDSKGEPIYQQPHSIPNMYEETTFATKQPGDPSEDYSLYEQGFSEDYSNLYEENVGDL